MGRERYWGGRSTTTRRAERESSGCMSGVLQLFDFHQFQLPLHQPCFKTPDSFLQEDLTILKGIEAPRNSLESEEGLCTGTLQLSSITKEGDLNLPMAIRLGTKVDNAGRGEAGFMDGISSEISTSPMTKSPNLVARLMGLDLLPDSFSPSSSTCSRGKLQDHLKEKLASAAVTRDIRSRRTIHSRITETELRYEMTGSRSLPETPRISSARRSSDGDPRLSLQINKENQSSNARQIVKQVKESINRRKVGLDITNTTRNGESQKTGLLNHTKVGNESSPGKQSTPLRSPRVTTTSTSHDRYSHSPRPSLQASLSASTDNELQSKAPRKTKEKPTNQPTKSKCKKGSSSSERFTQRLTKPPQISETATKTNFSSDKNRKKTPLSNQKPGAQDSKRCSQLSSCLSRKYNRQEGLEMLARQDDNKDFSNSSSKNNESAEFRYVNGILRNTGIYRDVYVSITKWFSPYHPLNPLIFHHLENSFSWDDLSPIRHRWNRKLLFQLVDEILVEILRPYLNMKPWLRSMNIKKDTKMTGLQLLERLWSRIQSLPAANCQILKDIDDLVEKDLPDANMRTMLSYYEESESIVFEIERGILDSLLHETTADFE